MLSSLIIVLALLVCSHAFTLSSSAGERVSTRFLDMKKGKGSRIPIDQRGEFMRQQKLMEARKQLQLAEKSAENVPIFEIFVRPRAGGLWIPCGNLQGDNRATALVNAWMSGFLTETYKTQLDQGVARSIFSQEDSFAKNIIENYKPFNKFKKEDLAFGYKVKFQGLEEKLGEQKVTELKKGMEKGWLDNVKEGFAGIFGGNKQ